MPSGQLAHAGALLVLEKLPTAQGAHRAGDGSLASATNVPGVHGCIASQNVWPGFSWNVLAGHAVHDAALMLVLKLPGLHGVQRALDVSVVFNSNVPGVHGCFASQYGWPTACWNLPAGQRSQATDRKSVV